MARSAVLTALVIALCCMIVGMAHADRLLLIPTGNTLSTGGLRAEFVTSPSNDNAKVYWANVGVSRLEIEGARFQDFPGADETDAIGAQIAVIPETSFTPGVAIGVRDIGDETANEGLLYDGRAFYLAVSKSIPITGGIPILFEDMRIHAGIGTDSLSGVFLGVEGTLPTGLRLEVEYDTEDINAGVSFGFARLLRAEVASLKGDVYYGLRLSSSF